MGARHSSSVFSGSKARELLHLSLEKSARLVGSAMGPQGRGVAYELGPTSAVFTRAGASIATSVAGDSGCQTVAARILAEAMHAARRELGDGTARLACIATALYRHAIKHVEAGVDPTRLSRAIRALADQVVAKLPTLRREAPSLERVAYSACNDREVSRMLSSVADHLSEPGAVDVREGWRPGVDLVEHRGFCFEVLDDVVGLRVEEQGAHIELDRVHVLVVNEMLSDFGPLVPVLEGFVRHDKALVVVARGIVGAAASALAANRASLRMHLVGLVPQPVGEHAFHALQDLCVACGATLIGQETGTSLRSASPGLLGQAQSAVIERGRCLLKGPGGNERDVAFRRSALLREAEAHRYLELDRERAKRRAARLSGYWAELRVAGTNEAETAQRVESARAAISAVQAAATSGVVPGAGLALAMLARELEHFTSNLALMDVEAAAREALRAALLSVRQQLASNAGAEPADFKVDADVVDPLSTTAAILHRAVSVAATMLSIEVLLC